MDYIVFGALGLPPTTQITFFYGRITTNYTWRRWYEGEIGRVSHHMDE